MIVTCRKCSTKFRFDERVITGDGAWLRCSRCLDVFFLLNPASSSVREPVVRDALLKEPHPEVDVRDFLRDEKLDISGDVDVSFDEIVDKEPGDLERDHPEYEEEKREKEEGPVIREEHYEEVQEKAHEDVGEEKVPEERDLEGKVKEAEEAEEAKETKEAGQTEKPEASKESADSGEEKRVTVWKRQIVYLIIVFLLAGVYFSLYTDVGKELIYERIFGMSEKAVEVGPAQVALVNVRWRPINNVHLGAIRVVEGVAVNESPYPMTRVKVKGEITDAQMVVLGAQESYCGNVLTDDELAAMTEEQIRKELGNPQGSDVSNDRIAPKGRIPFMIIFTREPTGVEKVFVTPSGAERLLP